MRFYGAGILSAGGPALMALEAHMPALRAEELLRQRGGELSPEAMRELIIEATGDRDLADDLYCQRVLRESRHG